MPEAADDLKRLALERAWSDYVLHRHAALDEAVPPQVLAAFSRHGAAEQRWLLSFIDEAGPRALTREAFAGLTRARTERIGRYLAHAVATGAPAWSYRALPLADLPDGDPLAGLAAWSRSAQLAHIVRQVTGRGDLVLVLAELWQFAPDHLASIRRHGPQCAPGAVDVVLWLTPDWRAEWGGCLMIEADAQPGLGAHAPRYGQMVLADARRPWGISCVLPLAAGACTLVRLRFAPDPR